MFRGLFDEKSIKTPISYKYNIKGIDALLSFSDKRMMPDIKKEIVENYGKNELEAIPLHTVLFTNDLFKDYLKDLLKKFSTIEFKIKKKFIEEEDETSILFSFFILF